MRARFESLNVSDATTSLPLAAYAPMRANSSGLGSTSASGNSHAGRAVKLCFAYRMVSWRSSAHEASWALSVRRPQASVRATSSGAVWSPDPTPDIARSAASHRLYRFPFQKLSPWSSTSTRIAARSGA